MATLELNKYLISKINLLDDDSVLDKIKAIVDKQESVYVLSDYHLKRLEESRKQVAEGDFYTKEEMDLKVGKWLNEK